MASSKRFISGAVCPQCQVVDKVYTFSEAGEKWRRCTRCDFSEELKEESVEELDAQQKIESEWQPVQFKE